MPGGTGGKTVVVTGGYEYCGSKEGREGGTDWRGRQLR